MSESSAAKIAANRLNAQKSTGPKTPEGKARSRANAVTHGLCAVVVEIPGDDPEVLGGRLGEWEAELNPANRAAQSYLLLQAVRRSGRLDRFDTVYRAKVAGLMRDARKVRKEERMRDIDTYAHMLLDDRCDVAVRRLMLTPEGCEYLVGEWEAMRPAFDPPAQWDGADQLRVTRLMGCYSAIKDKCPGPLVIATKAIMEHRDVARKLKRNENPDALMWVEKYVNEQAHQYDKERVDWLADKSERYLEWLTKKIETAIADLRDRKAHLETLDLAEDAEIPLRAMFDASDEGKLLHRYEMDAERSLLRCFKEVRELNKTEGVSTQADQASAFATKPPVAAIARTEPTPARNEPTERASTNPVSPPKTIHGTAYSFVEANITPDIQPNHRR
jgi:hypothetical protein